MQNPIDDLRTLTELRAIHADLSAELSKAERFVEHASERVAELDAAIAEKENMQ